MVTAVIESDEIFSTSARHATLDNNIGARGPAPVAKSPVAVKRGREFVVEIKTSGKGKGKASATKKRHKVDPAPDGRVLSRETISSDVDEAVTPAPVKKIAPRRAASVATSNRSTKRSVDGNLTDYDEAPLPRPAKRPSLPSLPSNAPNSDDELEIVQAPTEPVASSSKRLRSTSVASSVVGQPAKSKKQRPIPVSENEEDKEKLQRDIDASNAKGEEDDPDFGGGGQKKQKGPKKAKAPPKPKAEPKKRGRKSKTTTPLPPSPAPAVVPVVEPSNPAAVEPALPSSPPVVASAKFTSKKPISDSDDEDHVPAPVIVDPAPAVGAPEPVVAASAPKKRAPAPKPKAKSRTVPSSDADSEDDGFSDSDDEGKGKKTASAPKKGKEDRIKAMMRAAAEDVDALGLQAAKDAKDAKAGAPVDEEEEEEEERAGGDGAAQIPLKVRRILLERRTVADDSVRRRRTSLLSEPMPTPPLNPASSAPRELPAPPALSSHEVRPLSFFLDIANPALVAGLAGVMERKGLWGSHAPGLSNKASIPRLHQNLKSPPPPKPALPKEKAKPRKKGDEDYSDEEKVRFLRCPFHRWAELMLSTAVVRDEAS